MTVSRLKERSFGDPAEQGQPGIRRPVDLLQTAGAVVLVVGYILVVRPTSRHEWMLPKGHVEVGERPQDAAIRVVRHRTGLDIDIVAAIGVPASWAQSPPLRERVDWFLAQPVGGILDLARTVGDIRFMASAEAKQLLSSPLDREAVSSAVSMTRLA